MNLKKRVILIVFLTLSLVGASGARAQGGPPLVTDDPETPGNHHWEINIATVNQNASQASLYQLPYFDVNYGLGDAIQLKIETGGALYNGKYGWGGALAGVKWRFVDDDQDGFFISTYPQYYFGFFLTSDDPNLGQPGNWFLLPLEFAKHFGKFTVNPEVGYVFSQGSANQCMWGIVLSYKLNPWEFLGEYHANINLDGSGTQSLFNVGGRYDWSETITALFSVGHTLQRLPAVQPSVLSYLGVQLHFL